MATAYLNFWRGSRYDSLEIRSLRHKVEAVSQFAGKMMIEGGWDTQGSASLLGASVEEIREETQRAIEAYGKPGFTLCPILLNERANSIVVGDDRYTPSSRNGTRRKCLKQALGNRERCPIEPSLVAKARLAGRSRASRLLLACERRPIKPAQLG